MAFNSMKIAIASGKGGTGKTTIATNLAQTAATRGFKSAYFDCDVEEPNGHIFLGPDLIAPAPVSVPVPVIDELKCTLCGKCKDVCRYSAIAVLGRKAITFSNLCHSCGGCALLCPTGAISEIPREIGVIEEGQKDGLRFVHGKLHIGEAMSPPLIRAMKKRIDSTEITIIDAPPGTSCPAIEAVKGSDYVILVTEPTPFGLNDLKLAVEMLRVLKLPFGVVVNRAGLGDESVYEYCRAEAISLLLSIQDDRRVAEAYSRGELVIEALPEYAEAFESLLDGVLNASEKY